MSENSYKCVSLFCGIGGIDFGFERAGFKTILESDYDLDTCKSYRLNFPNAKLLHRDIYSLRRDDYPKEADIVFAGIPCQGFSEIGDQCETDPRNALYRPFSKALKIIRPKMFMVENVRGLVQMSGGRMLRQMISTFKEQGYRVQYKLLDAKEFGVPQTRTRVFIIGIREDLEFEFYYPQKTHGYKLIPFRTLKDAIWHLRDNCGDYYKGDVVRPFLTNGYSDRFMSRQRKRRWDQPSDCIVANAWNVPLHHDGKPMRRVSAKKYAFDGDFSRTLSIKESLLIQSFPEDFILTGDLLSRYRQVGNAVPPLIAYKLAISVKNALDGINVTVNLKNK